MTCFSDAILTTLKTVEIRNFRRTNLGVQIMKLLEKEDLAANFHEVQITIDLPKLYAEIVELYKASENDSGYVLVNSVMVVKPQSIHEQDVNTNSRRLEL
jgi:hypothetical protein